MGVWRGHVHRRQVNDAEFSVATMLIYVVSAMLLASALGQDHCKKNCNGYNGSPICASNRMTYANMCVFAVAACIENEIHGHPLRVVHRGRCSTLATTQSPA